jgi:Tol biopolymer transport system component
MRRALALATAAACLAPACAQATFPGRNGRIAFVRPGEGIYTVKPDGTSRKRVTPAGVTGGRCDSEPAFAPSGLELAFQTCDPARHSTAIGVMGLDGTGRRIVVRDSAAVPYPQTPAFAPGGSRLAFAAGAHDTRLVSVRLDGRGRKRLKQLGYEPAWSRAGLAYSATVNRERWCNSTQLDDVFALDPTLTVRRRLTRNNGSYSPDWAPDGRHVAYTRDYSVSSSDGPRVRGTRDCKVGIRKAQKYGPEIVTAKASGKSGHRLTRLGGSEPAWSPDGKLIAFERAGYIWTMTADGHRARRITKGTQPAWQSRQVSP